MASVAVDYTSRESLETAFRGQDVIIATFDNQALVYEKSMIDAAIAVGVQRFIPCDWGSITTDPAVVPLGIFTPLIEVQKYLREKGEAGQIEHTIFSVGAFMDSLLENGLLFDWSNRTTQLYGGGNRPFSSTSLAGVGKAIVGSLRNPEATKNRNIFIHEIVVSQAQVLELAKKHSGAEWKVSNIGDVRAELEKNVQELQESFSPLGFLSALKTAIFGGLYRSRYEEVDNDLVGLKLVSDEEFEAKVAKVAA